MKKSFGAKTHTSKQQREAAAGDGSCHVQRFHNAQLTAAAHSNTTRAANNARQAAQEALAVLDWQTTTAVQTEYIVYDHAGISKRHLAHQRRLWHLSLHASCCGHTHTLSSEIRKSCTAWNIRGHESTAHARPTWTCGTAPKHVQTPGVLHCKTALTGGADGTNSTMLLHGPFRTAEALP